MTKNAKDSRKVLRTLSTAALAQVSGGEVGQVAQAERQSSGCSERTGWEQECADRSASNANFMYGT